MQALKLVDMGFLYTETVTSPKHVAGLQIYTIPEDYEGNFTRDLYDSLMSQDQIQKPFNLKVKKQLTGQCYWQEDKDVELSYHVRFAMLPQPGTEDQLLSFIEHQHESLLDRNRPLWEMILVDGLKNNQFAIYIKVHHAMADGARANQVLMQSLNIDPKAPLKAFWTLEEPVRAKRDDNLLANVSSTSKALSKQVKSIPSLTRLTTKLLFQAANVYKADIPTPFTAPKTPFSVSPKRARRAALAALPLDRVKRLGKITDATINDVVVSVCDMAIHNYLATKGVSLNKPLVAQMPISLRSKDDSTSNNRVAISMVELAYKGEHPLERLMTIKDACLKFKNEAKLLTDEALTNYTLASQGLAAATELLKIDSFLPPMGNVLISNVPGPRTPLYMMGAEMKKCFPISVLPPGMSLNITLYSYANNINVGLIACRSALPDLSHLAEYIEAAFRTLESAVTQSAIETVSDQLHMLNNPDEYSAMRYENLAVIEQLLNEPDVEAIEDETPAATAPTNTDLVTDIVEPKMAQQNTTSPSVETTTNSELIA